MTGRVIAREETCVRAPVAVVEQRVLDYLRLDGLESEATDAFHEGSALVARAGIGWLSKRLEVRSLPATVRDGAIVIPIRWLATGPVGDLFPTLDANLELHPTEEGSTRLVLVGSYVPPLGTVGATLDLLVLNRVARATIAGFLARLAHLVRQPHPASEAGMAQNAVSDPTTA